MLARVDLRGVSSTLRAELTRPGATGADVGARGDDALRELTARRDGVEIDDLAVGRDRRAGALDRIAPSLRAALELARDPIIAWDEGPREKEGHHARLGIEVLERVVPVDRAGCYVPGGRAQYPSSVLMTVVPARVAGVGEV